MGALISKLSNNLPGKIEVGYQNKQINNNSNKKPQSPHQATKQLYKLMQKLNNEH